MFSGGKCASLSSRGLILVSMGLMGPVVFSVTDSHG